MYNLYYDEYDEMIDEIADKYEVVKNEAAYDRYNPQKYEFDFGIIKLKIDLRGNA